MHSRPSSPNLALWVAALAGLYSCGGARPPYAEELREWRERAESRLIADDGWLTIAGLFWLDEGRKTIGSGPGNDFVVREGTAPERLGEFETRQDRARFRAAPGVTVDYRGRRVREVELDTDSDAIRYGELSMLLIERGGRLAIRLRDLGSPLRRQFKGRTWFPPDESYRVTARFESYNPPKEIAVPNILGYTEMLPCPGVAIFRLHGQEHRLEPVIEDDQLFFIFRDETASRETYPSGRFLYAAKPSRGTVVLDFNKAYNPPCAFNPYTTCPLPPRQNRLGIRIEAGELKYDN
ncbi:MAG: DUF1684 domain-containing protein [Bryobacteraceae bacterium]